MSDNEFNTLKTMITDLNKAFELFQDKAMELILKNDKRLIKLEQICEDENNYRKRFWDNLLRIIPIILTIALLIKAFWGSK